MPKSPIPAAEYVRMSTDDQHYSIANQQAQNRRYCEMHNLRIVRTYTDSGRSGSTLRERSGLTNLLAEVMGGQTPFKAICDYDVSREGNPGFSKLTPDFCPDCQYLKRLHLPGLTMRELPVLDELAEQHLRWCHRLL